MKICFTFVALLLWGAVGFVSAEPAPPPDKSSSKQVEKKISSPQPKLDTAQPAESTPLPWPAATPNAAGFSLFTALSQHPEFLPEDGNLVLSPANLEPVLQALRLGAAGKTATELDRVLGVIKGGEAAAAEAPVRNAELKEGIGLWVAKDRPVKPGFAAGFKQRLGAAPETADFSANPAAQTDRINAWVREATDGKIEHLFEPADLGSDTRLVIASALAYEGQWDKPFEKKYTQPGEFQTGKGKTTTTDFMHQVGAFQLGQAEDGTRVLALPLQDGRQRCVLMLPPEGREPVKALTQFEKGLTPASYSALMETLKDATVDLKLPRLDFKVRSSIKAALKVLGAGSMFSARTADFTRLSDEAGLCVSILRHEAQFVLDEEGARGAAATGAAMATRGLTAKPKLIAFDRPFLFAIEEVASGRLLFLGRMVRPAAATGATEGVAAPVESSRIAE